MEKGPENFPPSQRGAQESKKEVRHQRSEKERTEGDIIDCCGKPLELTYEYRGFYEGKKGRRPGFRLYWGGQFILEEDPEKEGLELLSLFRELRECPVDLSSLPSENIMEEIEKRISKEEKKKRPEEDKHEKGERERKKDKHKRSEQRGERERDVDSFDCFGKRVELTLEPMRNSTVFRVYLDGALISESWNSGSKKSAAENLFYELKGHPVNLSDLPPNKDPKREIKKRLLEAQK